MKVHAYKLTPKLRRLLKKPIGTLIRGPPKVGVSNIVRSAVDEKPPVLIAVGDVVTAQAANKGWDLYIVDHKVMRKAIPPIKVDVDRTLYVSNPPSMITQEAWLAISDALKIGLRTKIVVDGEEDLLAIPALLLSPDNSYVVYGQPNEGVVLVRSTKRKKGFVQRLLDQFDRV
jgi:hypothetical protein